MQLSGELSKINLPNLLQLVKTGGLTGKVTVAQGARMAIIFIDHGNPVHVELEDISGVDALMELFLWAHGTFSFEEENEVDVTRSIQADDPAFSLERLLKEGIDYARKKRYLDELGITPRSVLKPTGTAVSFAREIMSMPGLERLDGKKTLAAALGDMNLSRVQFVNTVSSWLLDGLADVSGRPIPEGTDKVDLPAWVVARLKQDNPDISQSIIDMVIWVDRVKCWMYQLDADFYRIRKNMDETETSHTQTTEESSSVFAEPRSPDDYENPYVDVFHNSNSAFNPLKLGTDREIASFLHSGMDQPGSVGSGRLNTRIDRDWTAHVSLETEDDTLRQNDDEQDGSGRI